MPDEDLTEEAPLPGRIYLSALVLVALIIAALYWLTATYHVPLRTEGR